MDPLIEKEMTSTKSYFMFNPFAYVLEFLSEYGWYVVGGVAIALYISNKLRPKMEAYKQAKEDAEYHKDPDKFLARMDAIQRARERQQELIKQASLKASEEQKEREERKRAENLERLQKYGATGGKVLGNTLDDDYLPLSGGGSGSTYRPPKKSKCKGGGCGQ